MKALVLTWTLGSVAVLPLLAQSTSGPKPRRPWVLETGNAVLLSPPPAVLSVAAAFDGFDGTVRGAVADLNRDGTLDYIVKGPDIYCGTGGCPYTVINGATAKAIGHLGGNPLVVRAEFTRGFPNIDAYSHGSSSGGMFNSYVFDGHEYVARSGEYLEGPNLRALFRRLDRLPRWPPPCQSRDC